MAEERLKLAVYIDFDNIQIGVKDTLGKEFDVSLVLEALKERGEVVTKVAYGDWQRSGDQSRQMTQQAVQMVQRNVTPRGDKNGADINLALDALEMAFTRHHINGFAIVGGDSDFLALVEKLKEFDKRVFIVGGRGFTSNILQRSCHEFIAYENLLKAGDGGRPPRASHGRGKALAEGRPLGEAIPNLHRALKILAEREVAPQIGLLKSTLLQLDPTFTERDYSAGTFLEFMQRMEKAGYVHLRRIDRGFLVELAESGGGREAPPQDSESAPPATEEAAAAAPPSPEASGNKAEALERLKSALAAAALKAPNRPLYLRHIHQALRAADKSFDERRFGFRSLADLLHEGQREGLLRIQRDRKGVLRIFPSVAPEAAKPAEAPAMPPPALEVPPAAETYLPPPVEPFITEEAPLEQPAETGAADAAAQAVEAAEESQPAPRKGRGARPRGARRRATARRKPKEPTET